MSNEDYQKRRCGKNMNSGANRPIGWACRRRLTHLNTAPRLGKQQACFGEGQRRPIVKGIEFSREFFAAVFVVSPQG